MVGPAGFHVHARFGPATLAGVIAFAPPLSDECAFPCR